MKNLFAELFLFFAGSIGLFCNIAYEGFSPLEIFLAIALVFFAAFIVWRNTNTYTADFSLSGGICFYTSTSLLVIYIWYTFYMSLSA